MRGYYSNFFITVTTFYKESMPKQTIFHIEVDAPIFLKSTFGNKQLVGLFIYVKTNKFLYR